MSEREAPMSAQSIAELLSELEGAKERLVEAERNESLARQANTSALNAYNNAAKKIEAALAEIRKGAPHNSDWQRNSYGRNAE